MLRKDPRDMEVSFRSKGLQVLGPWLPGHRLYVACLEAAYSFDLIFNNYLINGNIVLLSFIIKRGSRNEGEDFGFVPFILLKSRNRGIYFLIFNCHI